MMRAEWTAILNRYGQNVTVTRADERVTVKAFVQPVLDKEHQLAPSPLGLRREEKCLYLGPAHLPLFPRESVVTWDGADYEVRSTRLVGDGHHAWAILQRKECGPWEK